MFILLIISFSELMMPKQLSLPFLERHRKDLNSHLNYFYLSLFSQIRILHFGSKINNSIRPHSYSKITRHELLDIAVNFLHMEISVCEASSSSETTHSWTYHVFLSFRGQDTRKSFTDHLFASLERKGITTFKDDKGLERGEVISSKLLKAIEESMFAIIVLSPQYASSTWCLEELQKIVECSHNKGLSVVPIFYGVEPSDVRYQKGNFEEAFRKHDERFGEDSEKVKRWREALAQVSSYSGWDSKDWHEAELIESIAQHIHRKLVPKLPSCTKNLVGIASRVQEVNKLIGIGLKDVCFVGIWGMGGIGKSTIAREVFETMQSEFEVSCFLANVREVCETKGLVHIQRQLLSHLDTSSRSFYDLYDGKKTIKNSLCRKKALLVLDDVSEVSQLENLAGEQDWFGPGSRVIITTRDKHLLKIHGVQKTYEVPTLAENEALHLFCLKAFRQDQSKEGYEKFSKEVVGYAGGLPLALEVLGSYLYGRTVDVWHSAMEKMKSVPNPKIQDTLKISYDGLDFVEKNVFLDIACFFKKMNVDKLICILENRGYCPGIVIEILIERSLVIRINDGLWMHDLLQEMGRNIVFQESPNDPGRRSRLWSQKDIDHVLTKNKGTEAIHSIVLNLLQPYEAHWSIEAFSRTSQLTFLSLCGTQLALGLNSLPSSLKVLHWKGCTLKTLPLKSQLDEIVDMKLSHSKIEQLWEGRKFLENLKYLKMSFSKNLKRSPDFSGAPNLETLVLKGCSSLTEVHPSLLQHKKVVILNLEGCISLTTLPGTLDMSSLEELVLARCSKFKILPEFGESMEHLRKLSLNGTAIRKLPSSLGCLAKLASLYLKDCKSLICLPDTIHGLHSLRILDISSCSKICTFPDGLKEIKCLEELHADETAIQELPSSVFYLDNLKVLSFAGCKGLVSKSVNLFSLPFNWLFGSPITHIGFKLPPSVSSLHSLYHINISHCNLTEESIPPDFFHLYSLTSLDLSSNNFVSIPSCISKLPNLEFLDLNSCKRLQLLPELPSSIIQLDASNCDSLEVSKFDPSKACILFASPIQSPFRRKLMSLLGKQLPSARFDMLITGCEIPSWFIPQKYVSWAKIAVHNNCPIDEWVGFALCFLLESYSPPELCSHEIECYLFGPKGKMFISSRTLPPMEPCYPHIYVLYLSIDEFRDTILEDDFWSEIEFALKCYCCNSLQIVRCGCRLVCKKDVEDWNKQVITLKGKGIQST